ncbi:uncharacterized protein LOC134841765 isoform X2 [Symsagittifera roscoffensis]
MILEDGLAAGNSAFQCCVYMHAAHSSQRLLISFRKILLDTAGGTNGVISEDEATLATTNWCDQAGCGAKLSFYDSWANNGDLFGCTCKDLFPAVMESASNKIKVCLDVPVGMVIENDWAFFATSFDESSCPQNETMLHCVNRRCVQRTLICDGVDNCGDRTDELLIENCDPVRAEVGEIMDDSTPLWWGWIWWVLLVMLAMMTTYWCCWRPGYIWWRLGCCRDLIPFLRACCLCFFTCTCAMNCGGTTCGRHPYKQQMQENNNRMQAMGARKVVSKPKPKPKVKGTMMAAKSRKGPITKQPRNPQMMVVEEEGMSGIGGKGGPKDEVYNVKVDYDEDDKNRNGTTAIFIDEFPFEEWSGMHHREGR